jgi:pimeloyl-ACP methyl ester carboxylesterase/membrane protease YdiL (CAAX protease family)
MTAVRETITPGPKPEGARHTRLRLFFFATYAIAYPLWSMVALAEAGVIGVPLPTMALLFIGGLAPTVAALWAAYSESGSQGIRDLLAMLVRWRVAPKWYAVASGAPAAVVLSAFGLGLISGSPISPSPPSSAWLSVPLMFAVFVLLGGIEEIGWRAFALPRLQPRFGALRASVLLGLIWGFWHAPQWFIPQTGQGNFPFPAFVVWVVALSVMFTWIFNGTRGSVLLVILTHAATNAFQGPWLAGLALLPEAERGIDPHVLVMVSQVVLSLAIVVLTRGRLGLPPARVAGGAMSKVAWIAMGAVGVVALLGGMGAFAQAVATERDRQSFPPPGRMVDVGGYRLHMLVMGEEHRGPTVILDAGMVSFSTNWYWVQKQLAESARVVAYDRAGLGWSDRGPLPRDARQSATELHQALQTAGIAGPYVLAGHSYGGLVARAFVDLYPAEVSGLVLVDASHPEQWARIPASMDGHVTALSNRVVSNLASVGLLRVIDPMTPQVANGLPAHEYAQMRARLALPGSAGVGADALSGWNTRTRPQVAGARPLGALPLAVLSVTEQPLYGDVLSSLQTELTTLSSRSIHRTVEGATHEDLISNPSHAAVVADAIREVLRLQ